ncbi:MAG: hypothetical protein KC503_44660, partial [Myxococcales bacterium]|nr:hypothetical protein [Myxococcales bacterium]
MARAYLHGVGCASVHGAGVQVLASASAFPSVLPTPRAPQRVAGRSEKVRFGRLDRPCKLGVIAASDLLDGSTALLEGCPPEQRAIVIGTAFGAHRANEQFESQIARDEPAGSPRLFAYTLASTAAAELSILLDLRGPLMTLAEGAGAGLSAIAQAADLIASGAARCAVTGAVESVGETLAASR